MHLVWLASINKPLCPEQARKIQHLNKKYNHKSMVKQSKPYIEKRGTERTPSQNHKCKPKRANPKPHAERKHRTKPPKNPQKPDGPGQSGIHPPRERRETKPRKPALKN
jgi:hypothetical protein